MLREIVYAATAFVASSLLVSQPSTAAPSTGPILPAVYGAGTTATMAQTEAVLRPYANGAGPSAIFRLGRTTDGNRDLFGIVDSIAWRIQFFALDDWDMQNQRPLTERIHWTGACRLPPNRRVWRVHVWPDRTVLQLQPEPTVEEILSPTALTFPRLSISADVAARGEFEKPVPSPDFDVEPTVACGGVSDTGPLPAFTRSDAVSVATGGSAKPFLVSRQDAVGSPFMRSVVTIGSGATDRLTLTGGWLTAVQELEPARSVNSGVDLRHFMLTARSGAMPGFAHAIVVVVRKSANGKLNGTMRIDTGLARVKTGQRFAAVSSKGEVLVIGTNAKDVFRIRACHFTDTPGAPDLCSMVEPEGVQPTPVAEPGADEWKPDPAEVPQRSRMWRNASWYVSQRYRIDMTGFPDACRRALVSCDVGSYTGQWTAMATMRFGHGSVERRGVPYGQRQTYAGIPTAERPAADLDYGVASNGTLLLHAFSQKGGVTSIVSDINNDKLLGDFPDLKLFGIDCSTLLAKLWGQPAAPTATLVDNANKNLLGRIRGMDRMSFGDAFLIRLSDHGTLVNHVAMFRESRPAGPGDSSNGVVVLESSSSCGGVCITMYDEAFFDGWALIGARPLNGQATAGYPDIPKDYSVWLTMRTAGTGH